MSNCFYLHRHLAHLKIVMIFVVIYLFEIITYSFNNMCVRSAQFINKLNRICIYVLWTQLGIYGKFHVQIYSKLLRMQLRKLMLGNSVVFNANEIFSKSFISDLFEETLHSLKRFYLFSSKPIFSMHKCRIRIYTRRTNRSFMSSRKLQTRLRKYGRDDHVFRGQNNLKYIAKRSR